MISSSGVVARSFNTQPPEGGCSLYRGRIPLKIVSTHSRLKAAAMAALALILSWMVSTHSRLKAAASQKTAKTVRMASFNTQPPEGGCFVFKREINLFNRCFNTQPPEGGC